MATAKVNVTRNPRTGKVRAVLELTPDEGTRKLTTHEIHAGFTTLGVEARRLLYQSMPGYAASADDEQAEAS